MDFNQELSIGKFGVERDGEGEAMGSTVTMPSACRFCSLVSRVNGEDPAGSAGHYEEYLLIERPLPWPALPWQEAGLIPQRVLELLGMARLRGRRIRPLMIAPDLDYSRDGLVRLLHYRRPAMRFATYQKRDYLIPEARLAELVEALLEHPDRLPALELYRQPSDSTRELLICTHGRVDAACGRYGFPIYQLLRGQYAPATHGRLRVWRSSHFGGHEFAPTLIDLPHGHFWGRLEPSMLDALVWRRGPVSALRGFYRGWSGTTFFAQLLERELFLREGWPWIDYRKEGQVLVLYEPGHREPLPAPEPELYQYHRVVRGDPRAITRAEVRVDFTSPEGSHRGAYRATIERDGQVMKQWHSRDRVLSEAASYRLTDLQRVESSRGAGEQVAVA